MTSHAEGFYHIIINFRRRETRELYSERNTLPNFLNDL